MIDFTTVIAVDENHLTELALVWPTWKKFRPELLDRPLAVICDGAIEEGKWREHLAFLDHPSMTLHMWDMKDVDQREKMLTGLVLCPPQIVRTPWYLKLDTDVVATASSNWINTKWFELDEQGRTAAIIAPPWGYSKPANTIDRLEQWASSCDELSSRPSIKSLPVKDSAIVKHARIIGWCCFVRTDWAGRVAKYCGERLPIPSQDTFLWYCAEKSGERIVRPPMSKLGWAHLSQRRRLQKACEKVMREETPLRRPSASAPAHVDQLCELVASLALDDLKGVEIGVKGGETSASLLKKFNTLTLTMIEPHQSSNPGDETASPPKASSLVVALERTEFASDRRKYFCGTSEAAIRQVPDSLDFAYIDADHSYESVKRDLLAWWPKLRFGGILCGHDYGHPRDRCGKWGVSRAVNEFADQMGGRVEVGSGTVWWITKTTAPTPLAPSSSDSHGIIYLLTGPGHAARLVASIWSVRKHYDGPITIFSTNEHSQKIAEACVADSRLGVDHRPFNLFNSRRNASYLTKVAVLQHSPYDHTVFLDADTLVVGDIMPMFHFEGNDNVNVTQFCKWVTNGNKMSRRISPWERTRQSVMPQEDYCALVKQICTTPAPAINIGVFGFRRNAEILAPWLELASSGRNNFVCDEIALQILLSRYPHRILDCRFNCSPILTPQVSDVRVWHFHGGKHLRPMLPKQLWYTSFKECVGLDIGGIRTWAPSDDEELKATLIREGLDYVSSNALALPSRETNGRQNRTGVVKRG